MNPPRVVRHLTDDARTALEAGRRRHAAFTLRRCQMVWARAAGQQPSVLAKPGHGAPPMCRSGASRCGTPRNGRSCTRSGPTAPATVVSPRVSGRSPSGPKGVPRRAGAPPPPARRPPFWRPWSASASGGHASHTE
jgi:hypothetical protein